MVINNPESNRFLTLPDGKRVGFAYESLSGWNMVGGGNKGITFSDVPIGAQIFGVHIMIHNDTHTDVWPFPAWSTGGVIGGIWSYTAYNSIRLTGIAGGLFDDAAFSDTGVVRAEAMAMYYYP